MIELHITDISKVVQQVLAPAFLLAGIGTFLTTMTQRLARIIDRAREVSFETDSPAETPDLAALRGMVTQRLARVLSGPQEESAGTESVGGTGGAGESADLAALRDMLAIRAKLIQRAILCCTAAAIIICGLIGVMFVDALLDYSLARLIAVVFAIAMGTMMAGLIYFLREVFIATASLRSRHIRTGDPKVRNAV
jgi:hypothetical protein